MGITSAIVLYAVLWFLTMFIVLPIKLRTQDDEGEVVPGTHVSAPANFRVGRVMWIVTLWATLVWLVLVLGLVYSGIGVRDIDFFHRMGPPAG